MPNRLAMKYIPKNHFRSKFPLALPSGDAPSCISLTDDGQHMAIGTLGGAVVVFRCDPSSLEFRPVMKKLAAHEIFVTSVSFVPSNAARRPQSPFCAALRQNHCALISVSADNCAKWHTVPKSGAGQWPFGTQIAVTLILLLVVYYVMVLLDL